MKRITSGIAWGLAITLVGCAMKFKQTPQQQTKPADLATNFASPPPEARPHTWWHWMNGNVTKEGITLDLEAMNRVGIGGFQLFQVGSGIPVGPAPYGSPENLELLKHAAYEADRLGLDFTLHNCPGWSSSGGPWITPDLSMKMLTMSETVIAGGGAVRFVMQQPAANLNHYHDLYVLAYPTPAEGGARIANYTTKANFPAGRGPRPPVNPQTNSTAPIDPGKIMVITQFMNDKGEFNMDMPAGDWTILRIGYTTTGVQNRPPPDGGGGLECDKFSREAMDFHFEHFFGPMLDVIKPLAAKGKAGALIDSYETGLQNWTVKFPDEFRRRMGYDITPYLPAIFGRVVRDADASERVLWDVRKVQAELMAENYYGRFAELCHQHGMKAYIEPYDAGNFDEIAIGRYADMPMGEFWQNQPNQRSIKLASSVAHINGRPVVGAESFTSVSRWTEYPYSLKALGDMMYTQGLNRYIFHRYAMQPNAMAAPGMTMGQWGGHFDRTNTWWDHGESTWLQYVTRAQYVLQQGLFVADLLYFTGEDSPARNPQRAELNPAVPPGYDFDTIDADSILTRLRINKNVIYLPDGMSYRVFVLPEKKTMTLELARKLRDLVKDGMILVVGGDKPQGTPGFSDYPSANNELRRIAADLWGDLNGRTSTEREFGKGRVFWDQALANVLTKLDIKPDFDCTSRSDDAEVHFIHRRVGDADVYFVANRKEQEPADLVCDFEVNGRLPEFWDAATGQMVPSKVYDFVNGRTRLPLHLDPSGSIFVVFRAPAPERRMQAVLKDGEELMGVDPLPGKPQLAPPAGRSGGRPLQFPMAMPDAQRPPALQLSADAVGDALAWDNANFVFRDYQNRMTFTQVAGIASPTELTGPWRVSFPPNLGAPPGITFDRLISWSDSDVDGVKYFSGTATYKKQFSVPASSTANGKRLFLDLGKVQVLAEVIVNGKNLGTLWKVPFRVEVTDAVRVGDNDLEIRVTNLWPNRLIGDERQPAENEYGAPARGAPPTTNPNLASSGGRGAISKIPEWFSQNQPKPPGGRLTFTTWRHWLASDNLLESGLIGPVQLREAMPIQVRVGE